MHRLFCALSILALAACGGTETANNAPAGQAEAPASFEASVTNAFVMAPLEGRDLSMGGATITVTGADARLVGASAAFAETIELHTMAMEDGTMRMRQVEGYDVAVGETLELKRGGNHFMLFGVDELVVGDTQPLRLQFELEGGSIVETEVAATVRGLGE
ncbi:MAG: copper chaperone PCu(A)C [Pseudomonadota bacterium]